MHNYLIVPFQCSVALAQDPEPFASQRLNARALSFLPIPRTSTMTRPQQLTSLLHATQRLSLSSTTATRPSLAFTARTHPVAVRHASWSLGGLGELFKGRRQAARDQAQEANTNKALASEQPKGLFDQAVEDERVQQVLQEGQPQLKQPTFVRTRSAVLQLGDGELTPSLLTCSTSRPRQTSRHLVASSTTCPGSSQVSAQTRQYYS